MEETLKKENVLIACSESHAVAVGVYGHLYTWGNSSANNRLEESEELNSSSDDSNSSHYLFEDQYSSKLGFSDTSIKALNKPVFFSLRHPIYEIKAVQVSCGRHFTAVVAIEKTQEAEDEQESEYENLLFSKEIDDFHLDMRKFQENIEEQDFSKVVLSNKIRSEVDEYLKTNNLMFIELFKSNQIKEESFINIMVNIVESQFGSEEIKQFITFKNMRLSGNTITLKPLYELVVKCRQGKGVLYILGQKEHIVPKMAEFYKSYIIEHDTLSYHLITLPDQVSVSKVSCGDSFVVFLANQGIVYSWGSKPSPALGKNRSLTYMNIKPIPELNINNSYVKDICCGLNHCIALIHTGVVYTWGEGSLGKLGNGRYDDTSRPEPISVENNDIVLIRAGHNSSFCKTREKAYFVWGDLAYYKFGHYEQKFSDKPRKFQYEFEVNDVAIGQKCCVFIAQNGLLYQSNFQEDVITCLNRKYKHLEGIQFYQVTAFASTFLALSTKGSLYSWNTEDYGELIGRANEPSVPQEIPSCIQHFHQKEVGENEKKKISLQEPSKQVMKVACTNENTFLLTDKGEVLGCGDNQYGQMSIVMGDLESLSEKNLDEFLEFQLIPRLSNSLRMCIKYLECGTNHVLAINENNRVLAWGANSSGQLGNGSFSKCEKNPELIDALKATEAKMVSAGSEFSLVLSTEGEIFSFGSAEFGKLGVGRVNQALLYSIPTKLKKYKGVKKISCGENHAALINSEDELMIWGSGDHGRLGCGSKESYFEPTLILTQVLWKEVSCGATHTLGISLNSRVFHWGDVCLDKEDKELYIPTQVKGLEEILIKKVWASNQHSAALTETGNAVYSWGLQRYKRIIGGKSTNELELAKLSATLLPHGERVFDVGVGEFHGAIVTDQGKVYTWGYSPNGRLGSKESANEIIKPFDGKSIDLSHLLAKNSQGLKQEFKTDLQALLQEESYVSQECYLKEVDQQIIAKFHRCIDFFTMIAGLDVEQEAFFKKVEHKQLRRLQQAPFDATLVLNPQRNEEINQRIYGWSALVTTYQVHSCYMFRLLGLKIKEEKKLEMLNLIYCDMENNLKLTYTAIYLSRMLLEKLLENPDITFPEFLDKPESFIYKTLLFMIVSSSEEDMKKFRKIGNEALHALSSVVNSDENGIDLDPTHTAKNTSSIKLTAYQMNKNTIDRRMNKLKQVMMSFIKMIDEFYAKEKFSEIVYLIIDDLTTYCSKRFEFNYKNFNNINPMCLNAVNTILKIVFEPLCKSLEYPDKHYLVYDFLFENKEHNLKSLSETVSRFFDGQQLGTASERWFSEVNKFLSQEENLKIRVKLVKKIFKNKADIEEKYIEYLFLSSLEPFDKEITVTGQSLVFLQRITENYFELLRVGNPSYDPLKLITKKISPVPDSKIFSRQDHLNLTLFTRSLRQDQSLVRCDTCKMLIPRDMAPSKYSQVIEIFDSMPPNSSEAILSQILATGPRRQRAVKILDYINQFEDNFTNYLKDFSISDKIKILIANVDTITASSLELDIEDAYENCRQLIENNREKVFKTIEESCLDQYKKRINHQSLQKKISNSLYNLERVLGNMQNKTLLTDSTKESLLFNVEYGVSNMELEKFSDTVMFSIFANKLREYTSKKEMSLTLFENLTNEMKDALRGFMKRSLRDLLKKKVVVDYKLSSNYRERNIIFCFEFDVNKLIIIATNSPKKINICGRDEFREEEILIYESITENDIAKMREECKVSNEKNDLKLKLPDKESELIVTFAVEQLVKLVGEIEEKISGYIQNIRINQPVKPPENQRIDSQVVETLENEQLKPLNSKT